MRLALALLATTTTTAARAEPETCRTLKPLPYAQLSPYGQRRLTGGADWETTKDWKAVTIVVVVDRAPHIARTALEGCPNLRITSLAPADPKSRSSTVTITVPSFAALSRVLQLPAVRLVQPRRPHRAIDFEDPLF